MEKEIFDCITKNNIAELKTRLTSFKGDINYTDENGMFAVKQHFSLTKTKCVFDVVFYFNLNLNCRHDSIAACIVQRKS